jgi:hypothetical protein
LRDKVEVFCGLEDAGFNFNGTTRSITINGNVRESYGERIVAQCYLKDKDDGVKKNNDKLNHTLIRKGKGKKFDTRDIIKKQQMLLKKQRGREECKEGGESEVEEEEEEEEEEEIQDYFEEDYYMKDEACKDDESKDAESKDAGSKDAGSKDSDHEGDAMMDVQEEYCGASYLGDSPDKLSPYEEDDDLPPLGGGDDDDDDEMVDEPVASKKKVGAELVAVDGSCEKDDVVDGNAEDDDDFDDGNSGNMSEIEDDYDEYDEDEDENSNKAQLNKAKRDFEKKNAWYKSMRGGPKPKPAGRLITGVYWDSHEGKQRRIPASVKNEWAAEMKKLFPDMVERPKMKFYGKDGLCTKNPKPKNKEFNPKSELGDWTLAWDYLTGTWQEPDPESTTQECHERGRKRTKQGNELRVPKEKFITAKDLKPQSTHRERPVRMMVCGACVGCCAPKCGVCHYCKKVTKKVKQDPRDKCSMKKCIRPIVEDDGIMWGTKKLDSKEGVVSGNCDDGASDDDEVSVKAVEEDRMEISDMEDMDVMDDDDFEEVGSDVEKTEEKKEKEEDDDEVDLLGRGGGGGAGPSSAPVKKAPRSRFHHSDSEDDDC